MNGFSTPILLLIFNRPDTTKQVFEAVRKIRPKRLYVAADGPRENKINEAELCQETRKIIDNVDWNCEVKTLFRNENLGCGKAVSLAINWFFETEEMGIILEDDCLPNFSFFRFCEELLIKYKDDERIVHIGGANFQSSNHICEYSFYFSKITHVWGWATWKRAWKNYDYNLGLHDEFLKTGVLLKEFRKKKIAKQHVRAFKMVKEGKIDTWDYQLFFSNLCQNGLSIIPKINLITNIGFGNNATHTLDSGHVSAFIRSGEMTWPLKYPPLFIADIEADIYTYTNVFVENHSLFDKGISKIRKIISKL